MYRKIFSCISNKRVLVRKRNLLLVFRHEAGERGNLEIVKLCSSHPQVDCQKVDPRRKDVLEKDSGNIIENETKPLSRNHSENRHVALLLGYCGQDYYGMQSFNRKRHRKTVERDLLRAMAKAGIISEEESVRTFKIGFEAGASRTDKGVSACRQLVTFRTDLNKSKFCDIVKKTNLHLPPEIRVFGCNEVTKNFVCWRWCDYRTYSYLTPTFVFAPVEQLTAEDYRIPESVLNDIKDVISRFKGTSSYHNFTTVLEPGQPNSLRVINEFKCDKPFIQDGLEFVLLTVKGHSFVLHQIRKMIGLVVAIVRGLASPETLSKAFLPNRLHLPTAPGLGLFLEDLHYTGYNRKFADGKDFDLLEWNQYEEVINNFKQDIIISTIVNTQKNKKPMLKWLSSLLYHQFEPDHSSQEQFNPLMDLHLSLTDCEISNRGGIYLPDDGGHVAFNPTRTQVPARIKTECNGEQFAKGMNLRKIQRAELRPGDSTVVLLLGYCGQEYFGMQRSQFKKTIEREILLAMEKGGIISVEDSLNAYQIRFQRASRTDKGVSACRQIVSFRIDMKRWPVRDIVEKINVFLPPDIHAFGCKKVTRTFCCWRTCDSRTYAYMMPSFAFAPVEELTTEDYRISASTIDDVNTIMSEFEGTRLFYNFTSGWDPEKPTCRRIITEFKCGQPFLRDGLEFVVISIKGNSFMLHQIRKMIGLTIAVARGWASPDIIAKAWLPRRIHLPIAPGLGLFLEDIHYDSYNKHFGGEFNRKFLTWEEHQDEIEKFKDEFIIPTIVNTEKREKLMLNWLGILLYHNYEDSPDENCGGLRMYRDALLNNKNSHR